MIAHSAERQYLEDGTRVVAAPIPRSPRRILVSLVLGVMGAGLFAGLPQAHAASAHNHRYVHPTPNPGNTRAKPDPHGPNWGCAAGGCASFSHVYAHPAPSVGDMRPMPDPKGPAWGCAAAGCVSRAGVYGVGTP